MILESLEISNYGSIEHFEAKFHEGYNYLPENDEVFEVINYIMRTIETHTYKFKFTPQTVICAYLRERDYNFRLELRYNPQKDTVISYITINDLLIPDDDERLTDAVLKYINPVDDFATFCQRNRKTNVSYVKERYNWLADSVKRTVDEMLDSGRMPTEDALTGCGISFFREIGRNLPNFQTLKFLIEYLDNLEPVKFSINNYMCRLTHKGFVLASAEESIEDKDQIGDLFSYEDNIIEEETLNTSDALLYDIVRFCMTFNTIVAMRGASGERTDFPVAFMDINTLQLPIIQQLIKNRQVLIFTNDSTLLQRKDAVVCNGIYTPPKELDDKLFGTDIAIDPLCKKALQSCIEKNKGMVTIVAIQRNLQIGFNRASKIWETLQKLNYIEQLEESAPNIRPLRVLVSLEDLDTLFQ